LYRAKKYHEAIEAFQEKKNTIRQECERQGRDFSKMGLSLETQLLIRQTEKETEKDLDKFAALINHNNSFDGDILAQLKATNPKAADYGSKDAVKREFMVGTPQDIKRKIDAFVKKGVSHFMLWFMDYPDTSGIELFAKEILPYYKSERVKREMEVYL